MHIGNSLRHHIESSGVSKKEFAKMLSTSEQNLHKILNKDSLQTSMLSKICHLLGLHPGQFFSIEDGGNTGPTVFEKAMEYHKKDTHKQLQAIIDVYDKLLKEKDIRIAELKEHIELMKNTGGK